jgi:hypothetical protein
LLGHDLFGKPVPTFPDHAVFGHQSPKIRAFTGYPMAGLTERAQANISMTYPVVI